MKKTIVVIISLFAFQGFANEPKVQAEQVKFITNFYMGILNAKGGEEAKLAESKPFFSKSLLELLADNIKTCKEKSRGDDICGFGASGGIFLQAQETGPDLNFKNSKFKAKSIGKNLIEASFALWPEHDSERKMQFKMVREASSWRVDDVIYFGGGSGREIRSMREQIASENKHYEEEARRLSDAYSWVKTYISSKDMIDRASQFINFPVEVCDIKNKCKFLKSGSKGLRDVLSKLNNSYGNDDTQPVAKPKYVWPKLETVDQGKKISPKQDQAVSIGPLTFTFKKEAWWLTKIDLAKMGK